MEVSIRHRINELLLHKDLEELPHGNQRLVIDDANLKIFNMPTIKLLQIGLKNGK